MDEYGKQYSDESFWLKVKKRVFAAGKFVIQKALVLYFCLQDPDTPAWAKAVIVGALGYFIVPFDAIPDTIPVAGYSDDLGALTAALSIVAIHVKPEHWERANDLMRQWFGPEEDAPPSSPQGPATPDSPVPGEEARKAGEEVKEEHPGGERPETGEGWEKGTV